MKGCELKALIKLRKISVAELSRMTGISVNTLRAAIKRNSYLREPNACKVCNALKITRGNEYSFDIQFLKQQIEDCKSALKNAERIIGKMQDILNL